MTPRPFFEGWYFKHQWAGRTAAFIPAHHRDGTGAHTASLQIVTDDASDCLEIPIAEFHIRRDPFQVRAGTSLFTLEGCRINCALGGGRLTGALRYGPAAPPKGDIMGPFRFVPFLQCRHSVLSMDHTVDGALALDGRPWAGGPGRGYVEGDRGASFPKRYLWTQSAVPGGSVMLSVADVPLGPGRITGCIGFVWQNGRELRLATYRGLRVAEAGPKRAVVRQGPWELTAELLEDRAQPLKAPVLGGMSRIIRESAACAVRYRLRRNGETALDVTSARAGFEAEWPEGPAS